MSNKKLRKFESTKERRGYLEQKLSVNLENIGHFSLDEKEASGKNCENMIGAAQIPLGVAGPLQLRSISNQQAPNQSGVTPDGSGQAAISKYYIPLATTEGALVASVNRGCKAVKLSGGATTHAHRIGATRGPVFYIEGLKENNRLSCWIKENKAEIKKAAESTSKHLEFKKAEVTGVANYVFVRFYFGTQDAMGMNMVTIATQKIVELIEKETGVRCLSIAGNFDIDKKPAWMNFIGNRGFKTWAEVVLPKKIVRDVLKVSPQALYDTWLGKCMVGSAMSGSLGFNAHFANIIAALFIATGQDSAHVVEGSLGITTTNILSNGDLYFAVFLPALMVGTVGGGTSLATQKEALEILRVSGGNRGENAQKFAEIVAGAVLAGELSLIASEAEGSLARAHEKLGR